MSQTHITLLLIGIASFALLALLSYKPLPWKEELPFSALGFSGLLLSTGLWRVLS